MSEPASTAEWLAAHPPPTGDQRHDAYLAAFGEHFALQFGIERPGWVTRPERFLDRFWSRATCRDSE